MGFHLGPSDLAEIMETVAALHCDSLARTLPDLIPRPIRREAIDQLEVGYFGLALSVASRDLTRDQVPAFGSHMLLSMTASAHTSTLFADQDRLLFQLHSHLGGRFDRQTADDLASVRAVMGPPTIPLVNHIYLMHLCRRDLLSVESLEAYATCADSYAAALDVLYDVTVELEPGIPGS